MAPQSFQAVFLDVRQFWKSPFQYSLLITSTLAPKILHLYLHFTSLPVLLYVLYLPTFLVPDVLNALLFWGLVHLRAHGTAMVLLAASRFVICLTVLAAASMQIAFYFETGGEIKWGAAKNFAHDPAGIKVLLSGSMQACAVSTFIVIFARLLSAPLYNGAETLLRKSAKTFGFQSSHSWDESKESIDGVSVGEGRFYCDSPMFTEGDECSIRSEENLEAAFTSLKTGQARWYSVSISKIAFIAPTITIFILLVLRPKTFPYAHMSGSLPYTLVEIWESKADFCQSDPSGELSFPFPDLVSTEMWEPSHGLFPGWMPTANISVSDQPQKLPRPPWLPDHHIHGFERWYNDPTPDDYSFAEPEHAHRERKSRMRRGPAYDPIKDALKIANLDQDLLKPLAEALGEREFHIRHVVLLSLESTRSDVFPFKKNSHLHDIIMKSHRSAESIAEANLDLSEITPNSELLTGEIGGFDTVDRNGSSSPAGSWRSLGTERGGINVQGAFTGSTTSLKSILGSHCGVQPLPVDFTVESHRSIYQPCIPQILNLFNHNKQKGRIYNPGSHRKGDEMNSMPWKSVYAQSITDQYDRQDRLNKHMGFSEFIVKDTLLDPTSKHHPPIEKESNYFGFPETELKPYFVDLFLDAERNKQRLFLSHLTSSSHHPWNLPESEGRNRDYLGRGRWGSEHPLNRYLNTIRYADRWIGEIMDMLEDLGVAEETLVVVVGDHGMAFEEDSKAYTTFENGQIKNLAVPLVFHHPSLPRIKLDVNATSLSIIPTILDLLIATSSLGTQDLDIASNLIHQYEGQSLIRPYLTEKNARHAWNVGVLNAGGAVLSVSSAAVPFRLVMPVCKAGTYRFTDTAADPNELAPVEGYSIPGLATQVEKFYGDAALKWVIDAEKIGKWWVLEQRRRWGYHGAGLVKDRDPSELSDVGTVKKAHWWNT